MNQRLKRDFGMDIDKLAGRPTCIAEGWREDTGHKEVPDAHAQPVAEQCGSSSVPRMPRQSRRNLTHLVAKTVEPEASRRAPACRSDAVRRSAGRSSAGADGRDQAIQLEEKGLSCCPYTQDIDLAQQMIGRDVPPKAELVEQSILSRRQLAHHWQPPPRKQLPELSPQCRRGGEFFNRIGQKRP